MRRVQSLGLQTVEAGDRDEDGRDGLRQDGPLLEDSIQAERE